MKYTKKISLGSFARKGEDFKDGDILVIKDEGRQVEGKFGPQDVFKVKFPSGDEKNLAINQTSLNKIIDAYGEESSGWVGKEIKAWIVNQNVSGRFIKVAYFTSPDQQLDEEEVDF